MCCYDEWLASNNGSGCNPVIQVLGQTSHPGSPASPTTKRSTWTAAVRNTARASTTPHAGMRLAVVLAALAVLYVRMPSTFRAPPMWGEDIVFFSHARTFGWQSLTIPEAGYLSFVQSLTAVLARVPGAAWAASIYFWTSIVLTLLVVWLVTSPRLALPAKPLLALAVVVVPMGYEELGTLTNIQWILPVGGFAMLFMTPPTARVAGIGAEALFLVLMALSGPFSIVLAPMFVAMALKQAGAERRRLLVLSAAVGLGALVQVGVIVSLRNVALGIRPTSYPWDLWITLPTKQMLSVFPPLSRLVDGPLGIIVGVLLLCLALIGSCTGPYRDQKRCMVVLAVGIALGGMYKFRVALDTQTSATRYFYFGSIFLLWTLCCVSKTKRLQRTLTLLVIGTELALLPVVAATPRTEEDFAWPVWAQHVDSGLRVIVPTAPGGWYTALPAASDGPLFNYSHWEGRTLGEVAPTTDRDLCAGSLDDLQALPKLSFVTPWGASGLIGDAAHPAASFPVVVLVDDEDRVVGFGYSGFAGPDGASDRVASGWRSVFFSEPKRSLRAYAVTAGGTACPLMNDLQFRDTGSPASQGTLVDAVTLEPGRRVSQRLSPKPGVRRIAVTLVTWGQTPSAYPVTWRVLAHHGADTFSAGAGRIDAGLIRDWQTVTLPVRFPPDRPVDAVEVVFEVSGDAAVEAPVGLPLMTSGTDDAEPATIEGLPSPSRGHLGISAIAGD